MFVANPAAATAAASTLTLNDEEKIAYTEKSASFRYPGSADPEDGELVEDSAAMSTRTSLTAHRSQPKSRFRLLFVTALLIALVAMAVRFNISSIRIRKSQRHRLSSGGVGSAKVTSGNLLTIEETLQLETERLHYRWNQADHNIHSAFTASFFPKATDRSSWRGPTDVIMEHIGALLELPSPGETDSYVNRRDYTLKFALASSIVEAMMRRLDYLELSFDLWLKQGSSYPVRDLTLHAPTLHATELGRQPCVMPFKEFVASLGPVYSGLNNTLRNMEETAGATSLPTDITERLRHMIGQDVQRNQADTMIRYIFSSFYDAMDAATVGTRKFQKTATEAEAAAAERGLTEVTLPSCQAPFPVELFLEALREAEKHAVGPVPPETIKAWEEKWTIEGALSALRELEDRQALVRKNADKLAEKYLAKAKEIDGFERKQDDFFLIALKLL
ncbi:hypothetical protein, conserved [Eimeria tenella]|uniref:Uncharacterized protein n=1 Tax=Eimeria tenella TaxID=5802 RepID=U6KQF9_EIMTE|nr:hypothetical protein, conserved [Eimeria tenella]CDJ38507.1 hypothetical protein, conserved [Eimeria tenella]|eukprot:XP_013229345.1 hypothetical protein, conserved [Eimeria tenella]